MDVWTDVGDDMGKQAFSFFLYDMWSWGGFGSGVCVDVELVVKLY